MANNKNNNGKNNNKKRSGMRISPVSLVLLILINLVILAFLGWNAWRAGLFNSFLPPRYQVAQENPQADTVSEPTHTPEISPTPDFTPTSTPTPTPAVPQVSNPNVNFPGMIVLSISEAGFKHLFAYHPENQPLTRLTYGEWDDIQPALSPDGSQVAFASNREGHWDIYVLDLNSGGLLQITNDLEYNGAPSWSPDGLSLAYEKYADNNLDIYIKSIDNGAEIRVTNHTAVDFEPAWHPDGSLIAFTSTRTGSHDIMVANLDHLGDEEFIENYTYNTTVSQRHPTWSPDGSQLAYSAPHLGYQSIIITDYAEGATSAEYLTNGRTVRWDAAGNYLLVLQEISDGASLAILDAATHSYLLPPFSLDGRINHISWGPNNFPGNLPDSIQEAADASPQAPWGVQLTPDAGMLYGRQYVIDIPGLTAPFPSLNALAIEPFYALKDRAEHELGWDLLSDLENAFIPLSSPLPPGRSQDWLYTGRAFALNGVLVDLDWMLIAREDHGGQTYWRIFVKTRYQDGSQGQPLTDFPWDFSARFTGSTTAYEQGGEQVSVIPEGYWIDFTALALDYGWQRFPALSNWQSYFQGTRYNVFAITSGLTWENAMLQLWPPEIFETQP
jgi:TolB protein